ncbi:hypothetical protein [Cryptosporangium aurantiacum]|nr:hypothetical protein [Cryptosporangium aurantiacum]
MDTVPRTRLRLTPSAVHVAWQALPIVVFLVVLALLPAAKSDDTCDGIGFGCDLNPRDTVLVIGIAVGGPALGIAVLIGEVTLLLLRRGGGASTPVTAGSIAAVTGWAVAGVPVFALVACSSLS